ncbi:MAG: SRPBCC family protein [Robiginitomaculum sp.]|nr:SRPBCC family protein [Robiginitomaculum sp.]MBL1430976.1 SRPBCC family protein [Robiginitomaculum sp.]
MNYGNAFGIEFRGTEEITYKGKPARSVTGTRVFLTEIDDLWDALTNPERIPRWFLPVSGDFRLGGHYQLKGHAGGKITECDPPKALSVTWEVGNNTSWVRVKLDAKERGTRLLLEHVMLKDADSESYWKQYGPGATGVGWDLSFLALNYHLVNNGATINPEENAAWMASDNGKAFIRNAAQNWGAAHIASGESADIADDMANLTAKFYTGE